MRAGGANLTPQHTEDISLCGLFLMEVARRIDHQFGSHHTSAHTHPGRPHEDINKLARYLVEKGVVRYDSTRKDSPCFVDPTGAGLDKLCNTSWVKDILSRVEPDDNLERGHSWCYRHNV